MGDVLDPKPPQWRRKQELEEASGDHVLQLARRLMEVLHDGVEPTTVQCAALRMVQKAVISNYQHCVGAAVTQEMLNQAKHMASHYKLVTPDGDEEV